MADHIITVLDKPDGGERVLIVLRPDGLFTYRHQWSEGAGWSAEGLDCGLYDSPETAEAEARLRVAWLVPSFH